MYQSFCCKGHLKKSVTHNYQIEVKLDREIYFRKYNTSKLDFDQILVKYGGL